MNNIKFRQVIHGKFHYWGYIDRCFVGPITNQQPSPHNEQFTGLFDKNGVEIYDGDILKLQWINEYVGSVSFANGSYILSTDTEKVVSHLCKMLSNKSEVVGNVHGMMEPTE